MRSPSASRFISSLSRGGAASGIYQVVSSTNANNFAVLTADSASRTGACVMPKLTGGGFVVSSKTNLTYSTSMPHGLNPGDYVYINFTAAGSPADGQYQVLTVPDATHFTTIVPIGQQPDPERRDGLPARGSAAAPLRQRPGPVGHLDSERDRYRLQLSAWRRRP